MRQFGFVQAIIDVRESHIYKSNAYYFMLSNDAFK